MIYTVLLQPVDFDMEELLSEVMVKVEDVEEVGEEEEEEEGDAAETRSPLESPGASIAHSDLGQLPAYRLRYVAICCVVIMPLE